MKKFYLDLQMFGEGGDGAGASAGSAGADSGAEGTGSSPDMGGSIAESNEGAETAIASAEEKAKAFEALIKKGGEYADEFNKRTQSIIDKRFKQTKEMEATIKSQKDILDVLSLKYGIDASKTGDLLKAINDDESMFEDAAFKEGLTTQQYREKLALQKENAELKAAEEEAKRRQRSEEIYSKWLGESEDLKTRYGLTGFDLAEEIRNPEFSNLLANGISLESAYKAIHFDDMLGGAMAQTAKNVEQGLANRIASRQSRPNENGISSNSTTTFKNDVNKLTNTEIEDYLARVKRGEKISFS